MYDLSQEFCHLKIKDYFDNSDPLTEKDNVTGFRILLVRPSSVGDALFLTPVVRSIRKKYPKIEIHVMTMHTDILEGNPNINCLIGFNKRIPVKYNKTFVLAYEFEPLTHPSKVYAETVGIELDSVEPEIFLKDGEIKFASDYMKEYLGGNLKYCCFHGECIWPTRQWDEQKWGVLAAKIRSEYGLDCVTIGASGRGLPNTHTLKKLTLRHVAAILYLSEFNVCIDSGIMHISIALNKPTFTIFGITDYMLRIPERFYEFATRHYGVTYGSHHHQEIPADTGPKFPECVEEIRNIPTNWVFSKVSKFLNDRIDNLISIVIPTYNTPELNSRCIKSILKKTKNWDYEIVVADDNSNEAVKSQLRSFEPLIRVSISEKNLGFTKNSNRAAKETIGKYICMLNSDTEIINGEWLIEAVKMFEETKEIGVIGAKLLYEDNTIQHAGICWHSGLAHHIYKNLPEYHKPANKVRYYNGVTGACFFVRMEDWKELGGFCEEFANSAEDTDFCFRMIKFGKKVAYNPKIVLYHLEGATRGRCCVYDKHNSELLIKKHGEMTDFDFDDYVYMNEYEARNETKDVRCIEEVPMKFRNSFNFGKSYYGTIVPHYRLDIGSGENIQDGYIHIDVEKDLKHIEFCHDLNKGLPIGNEMVKEIILNHVVEHISWRKIPFLFRDICRTLVKGGICKLRTPDLDFITSMYRMKKITQEHPDDENFINRNFGKITPTMYTILKLFSGQDHLNNFHYCCFDKATIENIAKTCGFSDVQFYNFGRTFSPGEIQCVMEK